MNYHLTHSISRYRGIGVLRLARTDMHNMPVVILLHGLDSSKERWLTTMYAVAHAGFDVVAPDLHLHGDHPDASTRRQRFEADYVGSVGEIVYQTVADIPELCLELGIDPGLSGILGISAGGMIAHALAIQEPKFKAIVAAITGPDWMKIDPSLSIDPSSPEGMLLNSMSPSNHAENYPPIALNMLTAELDTTIYPIGSIEMYERLKPIYTRVGLSERLSATVYSGIGHHFTDTMAAASVEWFERFLIDG